MSTVAPIVVIPIHRSIPTVAETVALRRCRNILRDFEISIVCPHNLNISEMLKVVKPDRIERIDPKWLISKRSYNQLLMSGIIFGRFPGYTHMLLHEPDAIVISDRLHFWCNQPFDYIGAPWFDRFGTIPAGKLWAVGNSGLSLWRLDTMATIFAENRRFYTNSEILSELTSSVLRGRPALFGAALKKFGSAGQVINAWKSFKGPCDVFFSFGIKKIYPDIRIADPTSALSFSWEVNPRTCFILSEKMLPFGMHAWTKYDFEFVMSIFEERQILDANEVASLRLERRSNGSSASLSRIDLPPGAHFTE